MIGRVGTAFGAHGVNIVSAAVGRQPESANSDGGATDIAVMAVTTDGPIPREVTDELAASDGFQSARAVAL
jgi:D-3-phosphoglycerate dehydrogenase